MAVVVRCCAQEPKTQMAGARACLDPAAEIGQAPGEGSDVQGLSNSRPTFVGERRVPALDQLGPLLILPCMATAAHANPAQRPLALNLGSLVMDAKGSAKLWRQRGTRSPEHHHIARGGAELNTTPSQQCGQRRARSCVHGGNFTWHDTICNCIAAVRLPARDMARRFLWSRQ